MVLMDVVVVEKGTKADFVIEDPFIKPRTKKGNNSIHDKTKNNPGNAVTAKKSLYYHSFQTQQLHLTRGNGRP